MEKPWTFNHSFYVTWPDLHQSLLSLLVQNQLYLMAWDHLPLIHIPVFSGFRSGLWPWQGFDLLLLHPHLDWDAWVTWSIVNPRSSSEQFSFRRTFFMALIHVYFTNIWPLLAEAPDHQRSYTRFHSGCETLGLKPLHISISQLDDEVMGKAGNWTHQGRWPYSITPQSAA